MQIGMRGCIRWVRAATNSCRRWFGYGDSCAWLQVIIRPLHNPRPSCIDPPGPDGTIFPLTSLARPTQKWAGAGLAVYLIYLVFMETRQRSICTRWVLDRAANEGPSFCVTQLWIGPETQPRTWAMPACGRWLRPVTDRYRRMYPHLTEVTCQMWVCQA